MQKPATPNSAAWETEQVFDDCRDGLVRYLRYHLNDYSEAEDIAQESFVRFFQARIRNEPIHQPRAWLYRVAHNLLIDQGRKKRPELLDEQGWLAVEDRLPAITAAAAEAMEAKVQVAALPWKRLSPMELECLRLRSEDLKLREIAEVLELSISSVVSYISRALAKLRRGSEEAREAPEHPRATAAL